MVPIDDPMLSDRIDSMIDINLRDDSLAWSLVNSTWKEVVRKDTVETHLELQRRALTRLSTSPSGDRKAGDPGGGWCRLAPFRTQWGRGRRGPSACLR